MPLRVEANDYTRVSAALRHAADGGIKRELTKAMGEVAKPYGQFILASGASRLPRHGGLAYTIAGSKVGVQVSTLRATISLRGHDTKSLDAGVLRHPVFGRKNEPWQKQSTPVGIFSTPFRAQTAPISAAMLRAADRVLDQIASGG